MLTFSFKDLKIIHTHAVIISNQKKNIVIFTNKAKNKFQKKKNRFSREVFYLIAT